MASLDLRRILADWEHESSQISVRKIVGDDGTIKIQMRLDLGVLQMELAGRPDGKKPHGCESLLAHHEKRLARHIQKNGTELGFELTVEECAALREEAVQYYHRYLAEFVLEDFEAVESDTARNLRVLDLYRNHAHDESDQFTLEQHRPYLVMMNARSKAHQALRRGAFKMAQVQVKAALQTIHEFYVSVGQEEAYEDSSEVSILQALAREIRARVPTDPLERLEAELQRAVEEERYEDAVVLRDRLAAMQEQANAVPVRKRKTG